MNAPQSNLECTIEAHSSYMVGRPMPVTGTLRNNGPVAVWVLRQSTFLSPRLHHYLVLRRDGEFLLDRDVPSLEEDETQDFIRIAPGESVSRRLDIDESYDIQTPGSHEVALHMPMLALVEQEPKRLPTIDRTSKSAIVESAPVTIEILDKGAARRAPEMTNLGAGLAGGAAAAGGASGFPAEPADPEFIGMNRGEVDTFFDAARWAYRSILAGLSVAEGAPNHLMTEFFDQRMFDGGVEAEKRRGLVVDNLRKMATEMASKSVFRKSTDNSKCNGLEAAFVGKSSSIIDLCPNIFSDTWVRFHLPKSAAWARAFTVVHEMSHAAFRSEDLTYEEGVCKSFAASNPNKAIRNAQNYAYFAMLANPEPPEGRRPNTGIWDPRDQPGGETSHNPAVAALNDQRVVMVAYRDDVESKNGKLWCKALLIGPDGETYDWQRDTPIEPAGVGHCRSLREPALAAFPLPGGWSFRDPAPSGAWRSGRYYGYACVYIDVDSRRLTLLEARQTPESGPGVDMARPLNTNLSWHAHQTLGNFPKASDSFAPSLAFFADKIFCTYVDESGAFRSCCNSDVNCFGGVWSETLADYKYQPESTPALVVFNGLLLCAFNFKSNLIILEYRNGAWGQWASIDGWGTTTLALAHWDTVQGPRLVAIGKSQGGDMLSYAISKEYGGQRIDEHFWSFRKLTAISSPNGAALVACGDTLHALYRGERNKLNWMVANPV